ncbi:SMI1/KNR4 family protein [Rhodanobacter sp. DHB23]|uniref:SMI1/KNR4 family protein n=1 Tax=Rhodanobacter sp. DHB23 TaxID=2775923 RepID=UPI001782A43E|nr:SMI1/KNR4 family protein [Rhodanobacter sp. DHB23]MBD8872231.1 SMI1/KNR4 family protein [Rhodanobacter sp. DHB23]
MATPRESWLNNAEASSDALDALLLAVPALPQNYINLLARGNGGEVELAISPYNFCLDSAEAALNYWGSGTCTMQNVFVFGGNGGGALLALDMRAPEPWPVISFDPIDPEGSIENVATNFSSFLSLVAQGNTA